MKIEKGIISNAQLQFMMIAFMQSMALTLNFSFSLTKQSTWLVVVVSFVISIFAALMLLAIGNRFPGKNLIQINDMVFGRYFGKLVSAVYIWFFFQVIIHYMYFLNSFWITFIMPETPRAAFLIMFGLVCAYAVKQGLETIARCSVVFTISIWATTFTLFVLLLGDMNPQFLLPVLEGEIKDYIQSTHTMLAILFGDVVVFLMIFPYTNDQKKLKKPVLVGMCISALWLLIVTLRDAMVLGPRLANSASASFTVAREINIADILTRLDILVAISLLITVFVKVIVMYYATAMGTAQLLNLKSYKPLVIPIGVLAVSIGMVLYPSDMEQVYAAKFAWPFNAAVYEYLLPLITLIVIAIQKLRKKKKAAETE